VFAVDTNIFIYAHFERYRQHDKANAFCKALLSGTAGDWAIGWQIVYEYARITTHRSIHEVPLTLRQALADMAPYLESRHGHVLSHSAQHRPVLEAVAGFVPAAGGNFIHDVHYAALLHEHGVARIYTADSDFRKFDFLEVIDPTA
jgi:predicted nucleic acid-binding protein